MEQTIKKVPLDQVHRDLGGKIIPFAGFDMPVRYSSDKEEHFVVREKVGLFDVSHMGQFFIYGNEAYDLIQSICSNDVGKLVDGKIQYSCLMNNKGGIVDDLLVYQIEEGSYMLVVNASNIDKDFRWIIQNNAFDCDIENRSDEFCLLALQGPKATDVLQKLTQEPLEELSYYNFGYFTVCDIEGIMVSETGYTGAGGYEILIPKKKGEKVWKALLEAGKEFGLLPCGLGARDTLRLEKGYCLYGNDIDDSTTPMEAGLGWVTKKDIPFLGSTPMREKGVKRKLVYFKMEEKGIPRKDYTILNSENLQIGTVTSGGISPVLNLGIGIGYVEKEFSALGTKIQIEIRNKVLQAEVVKPPFV